MEILGLHMSTVKQEWIDHNDHMNLAYYPMAFYEATNALALYLGMDREFKDRTHTASFLADMHFSYKREVRLNDPSKFFQELSVLIKSVFIFGTRCITPKKTIWLLLARCCHLTSIPNFDVSQICRMNY